MKVLCKFQIDIPINAIVTAVQSLEDIHTFILWQRAKEYPKPIFLYNYEIENSPTSFAHNSVWIGPNNFKFGTETRFMVLQAIPKFGAN